MKHLVEKVKLEVMIWGTILDMGFKLMRDSLSDWYNYKIKLKQAIRANKLLYIKIFDILLLEKKDSGVTNRDKRIWIERLKIQHLDYLRSLGKK